MQRLSPPPHNPIAAPADDDVSPRDVQRNALHDLVKLATDSAATESQIERQLHADLDVATKEFDRQAKSLEDRFKKLQQEIRQKHQEKLTTSQALYEDQTATLKSNDEAARRRIDHDFTKTDRDIKDKFQQATWLADSLYEAADRQIHDDAKKIKEQVETHLKTVEERETEATNLLDKWGQKIPTVELPADTISPEQGEAGFAEARDAIERDLLALKSLRLPRLFVGLLPFILVLLLLGLVAAVTHLRLGTPQPQFKPIGIAVGSTLGAILVIGLVLRLISNRSIRNRCAPLAKSIATARSAARAQLERAQTVARTRLSEAKAERDLEVQSKKDRYAPLLTQARSIRDTNLRDVQQEFVTKSAALELVRDKAVQDANAWIERKLAETQQRCNADVKNARENLDQKNALIQRRYEEARADLERRLREGLANTRAPIDNADGHAVRDWNSIYWSHWQPPKRFPAVVPFGEFHVDLRQIAERVPKDHPLQLKLPGAFDVPATLAYPQQASLLIQTDRTGRDASLRAARMVMTRLLTSLPPGRVRFTIIDPVGLGQNFSGFMHLADHDEALVGGRIWTETDHVLQRLTDLTEHMETVIQKYLRNEFETIDEYNAQAGELAEPYRYLVIADFPAAFEDEAARRLAAIVSTGSRCGVYTIIVRDTRQPVPNSLHLEELEARSVNLVHEDGRFVWKDSVFEQFPLTLDSPPAEDTLMRLLDAVGRHAKEAKRVEVPFDNIVPSDEKFWSGDSSEELVVPMGRTGATRLQSLRLGRGVAQHVLIAGKTGSGKSTLLHALVTNLAMWYAPDQVEFYLIDFKKGVEFKTYATHDLPHARAIAVESDREFGLSVLQRLDAELTRRGNLFRKLGVQDLAAYREASKGPGTNNPRLPRTLLIIDEFQEFFSEDDKLAQDAGILLDRLVRQGRAFGIHVLLGSQTIGGTSGLARSTIGQMAVRVALQTSEADSQLILGDSNSAARLLSRPGEAIYNDQGGLVEGNSPFQIAWLPDEQRERYLARIQSRTNGEIRSHHPAAIVFEGNAPADITKNACLNAMLNGHGKWSPGAPALGYVGEPVAIKDPTAVPFRRQSGSNLLVIGQYDDSAMALLASAMLSLAAQQPPDAARFYVLDGSPADSPLARILSQVKETLPHDVKTIDYRSVPDAINELHEEMTKRQSNDSSGTQDSTLPSLYLVIYALQRYRALRKQEDSFGSSFSMDEGEKKPQPDKQLAELLRDGPALGIHVLAWSDTPASIDRTFDRGTMREFDHRILFQMSANDSSNLIDSPAANKLGLNRALAYSEEQGTLEKFRPYALPTQEFLTHVKDSLAGKRLPTNA
jgi:DNA segregation ATPase FtsK/SpoIIIE, S-DNA-T family